MSPYIVFNILLLILCLSCATQHPVTGLYKLTGAPKTTLEIKGDSSFNFFFYKENSDSVERLADNYIQTKGYWTRDVKTLALTSSQYVSGLSGHSITRKLSASTGSFLFKNIFGENIFINSVTFRTNLSTTIVSDTTFVLSDDLKKIDSIEFNLKGYKTFYFSYSRYNRHASDSALKKEQYQYIIKLLPYNNLKLFSNERFAIKKNRLMQIQRKWIFNRQGGI